jgi:hypothetical protein
VSTRKPSAERERAPFRVGDRVRFQRVFDIVEGVVVEDRGPIGVGGRRLSRIEFTLDPDEKKVTELPAEDIEPVR